MGPPTGARNGLSRFDTALHRAQRGFMKGASSLVSLQELAPPEEAGGCRSTPPACGCQPLLQVQPQSQEPPVVQVQSAGQPQPQGQSSTGAWGSGVGREQVQVMASPDGVDEADGDDPAHGPSIHSPVGWRVNR
jgi:hypothetical protein